MKLWDYLNNDDIEFIYCSGCGTNCGVFKDRTTGEYWCQSCAEQVEKEE